MIRRRLSSQVQYIVDVFSSNKRVATTLQGHVIVNVFFFFSSRRRHTRLQGDWSSDVCSSDLTGAVRRPAIYELAGRGSLASLIEDAGGFRPDAQLKRLSVFRLLPAAERGPGAGSEERRGGEEGRSRGAPDH